MNKLLSLSILSLLPIFVCANKLHLVNDSSYMLRVVVYDANNAVLTEATLEPTNKTDWTDSLEPYGTGSNTAITQPPYTVKWFCPKGALFGTCSDLAPGSRVSAQSCSGPQVCN